MKGKITGKRHLSGSRVVLWVACGVNICGVNVVAQRFSSEKPPTLTYPHDNPQQSMETPGGWNTGGSGGLQSWEALLLLVWEEAQKPV